MIVIPSLDMIVSWNDTIVTSPELENVALGRLVAAARTPHTAREHTPHTHISIQGGKWHVNGRVTYPGAAAEGLLMNVRVVNAVFEDAHKPTFDPERNTAEFIARVPEYVANGIRAFTINLQGGWPGYEGALCTAFTPDGSLRDGYMRRVRRVIETCDRNGAAVILGCYYQRQDQVLRDDEAVRTGVRNVVAWLKEGGWRNVLLEIANEFGHPGFDRGLLKTPEGQVELIRLAKRAAPDLPVSTSGGGGGVLPEAVARAADFVLVHFNDTPLEKVPRRIAANQKHGKPVVCNEDQKTGTLGAKEAELCVAHHVSWGLMAWDVNQKFPFRFEGAADDPVVYTALRTLGSHRRH